MINHSGSSKPTGSVRYQEDCRKIRLTRDLGQPFQGLFDNFFFIPPVGPHANESPMPVHKIPPGSAGRRPPPTFPGDRQRDAKIAFPRFPKTVARSGDNSGLLQQMQA